MPTARFQGADMTCQVIVELRARRDSLDRLRRWMREKLPDTRAYDGCVSVYVVQDQDEPTAILLLEQFVTRSHYESYLQWRTASGAVEELVTMLEGEPSFRYCDYFGV